MEANTRPQFPPPPPAWAPWPPSGAGAHWSERGTTWPTTGSQSHAGHGAQTWSHPGNPMPRGGMPPNPPSPPGSGDNHTPARLRSKSRSRHRGRHSSHHDEPQEQVTRSLKDLTPQEVADIIHTSTSREWKTNFISSMLSSTPPDVFKQAWSSAPQPLKTVVWEPPADVIVEWKGIVNTETRKSMCMKLNDLRRERCLLLAKASER